MLALDPEGIGKSLSRLAPVAVVQVAHRGLDVCVAHPGLDLDDVGAGDGQRAEGVP